MTGFDYSTLKRKIAFTEYLHAPGGWAVWLCLVGAAISLSADILISLLTHDFGTFSGFRLLTLVFAIGGAIAVGAAHRTIRLTDFARTNNLTLCHNMPYDNRPGIIFGEGRSRVFSDVYQASDRPFTEIGNFRYTVGSGRNQRNVTRGFIRIKLPRRLPNIILDAKSNNTFGFSNLPLGFSANQKLELEGDFNKYFTLYAPAEYKLDALYIFTPDVMQALVESAHKYDCEIIDDDLYIYSREPLALTDPVRLEEALLLSRLLHRELSDQTDYYADSNAGDRSLNIIAPAGARLKTRLSTASIVLGVIIISYTLLNLLPVFLSLR